MEQEVEINVPVTMTSSITFRMIKSQVEAMSHDRFLAICASKADEMQHALDRDGGFQGHGGATLYGVIEKPLLDDVSVEDL